MAKKKEQSWIHKHSLSLGIAAIYVVLQIAGTVVEQGSDLYTIFRGHADDTFGALIIVLAAKWLREQGSPASK